MLVEVNGLLERMCNLMNITSGEGDKDKIDIVLDKMWLFNQTYSFAGFERVSVSSVSYSTSFLPIYCAMFNVA